MKYEKNILHYNYFLFIVDLIVWASAFIFSFWFRHPQAFPNVPPTYLDALVYVFILWALSFKYFGLYNGKISILKELKQLIKANIAGLSILLSISFFYRGFEYSRISAATFIICVFMLNLTVRQTCHVLMKSILRNIKWTQQVLLIGCGEVGKELAEEFSQNPTEFTVIGFLDDDEAFEHCCYLGIPCMGKISDLEMVLERNLIDEVIIACPSASWKVYKRVMDICNEREVKYRFVPKLFKLMLQNVSIDIMGSVPLVGLKGNNLTGFNYLIKRGFDIVLSIYLLLLTAPVMILTAISIKMASKGPVFYVQERIGYNKEKFKLIKFRSMAADTDDSVHKAYVTKWINDGKDAGMKDGATTVHKLTKDPRIIPYVGTFIRKYSIDELPQLFNVLMGNMSLVGPRPCLQYELEQFKKWHKARFDILPGITGLWQVSGRNRLNFDEMVTLDIGYLQHWSFTKDIIILLKTPFVALFDKAY